MIGGGLPGGWSYGEIEDVGTTNIYQQRNVRVRLTGKLLKTRPCCCCSFDCRCRIIEKIE